MKDYVSPGDRRAPNRPRGAHHDTGLTTAQSKKKTIGWGGFVGLLVVLTLAGVVGEELGLMSAAHITSNGPPDIETQLTEAARAINSKAPIRIDALTRLDAASAGPGKRFLYSYTVLADSEAARSGVAVVRSMTPLIKSEYCSGEKLAAMRHHEVTVTYQYQDERRRPIASIDIGPRDCD